MMAKISQLAGRCLPNRGTFEMPMQSHRLTLLSRAGRINRYKNEQAGVAPLPPQRPTVQRMSITNRQS
jgi:hypothetical protein